MKYYVCTRKWGSKTWKRVARFFKRDSAVSMMADMICNGEFEIHDIQITSGTI